MSQPGVGTLPEHAARVVLRFVDPFLSQQDHRDQVGHSQKHHCLDQADTKGDLFKRWNHTANLELSAVCLDQTKGNAGDPFILNKRFPAAKVWTVDLSVQVFSSL